MYMKYLKNKKFLISIGILLISQAFLYWFLKFFQTNPHYINYPLDQKIPFIPNFIYIYNTFYPFIFLAFLYLFQKDETNYMKGIIAGVIGFLICDIIFLCYPTIMLRPPIPETNFLTNFILKVTFFFDTPALNCFPSIHCLFCFQIIYNFIFTKHIKPKIKISFIIYSLLIILSTVLVKQHYFFDIISALLICIIANLIEDTIKIYNKLKPKIEAKLN